MTEELFNLMKEKKELFKKSTELGNQRIKIDAISDFIKTFRDLFLEDESIKAINNLEQYVNKKNEVKKEIRKIKFDQYDIEKNINRMCYHDIVINSSCYICENNYVKKEFGIKIDTCNYPNKVYYIINELFENSKNKDEFMKKVFNYAESIQDEYNVKIKRRY